MKPITVLVVAASSAIGLHAQQAQQPAPPPIFRVQVDAIELDAFVTDAQGNPVTDLTIDDFEVLEDGRPQAVTSFALVNIPIERVERPLFLAARDRAGRADEHACRRAPLRDRARRGAIRSWRPRTRHFLRRFIEQHFAANDIAAIVYVGRGRS